jgi:2-enoate reductase
MNRTHLMQLLEEAKVRTLTKTTVLEITDEGLLVANESGEAQVMPAETVVLAVGMRPNNGLYEALKDIVQEIYSIGDCVEPRKVINAVWEGFRKARLI